ncbi:MAG: carbohydrate ABC transporter permease [Tyzzerella sp.]|nr:carbohydrate ABC transporter permease [Tyzzerella sp.]
MKLKKKKVKAISLGKQKRQEILKKTMLYALLVCIGFVFLYPFLYMFINSFMSPEDLMNPAISWIPSKIYFENYKKAFATLDFGKSFWNSLYISLIAAVLQTAVAAVTGYGLARFNVKLKGIIMILILATFVLPVETLLIPRYVMFNSYKLIDSPLPTWLSAFTGQGLKSAVFILVFQQIFNSYPISLDEAAELDGAGKYKVFYKIALPIAKPAIVLSMLFSFVWYWNETRQSGLYFGEVIKTLPMKLGSFAASYASLYEATGGADAATSINEAVTLAGTMLSCLPILIMFIVLQKQFVESIEKSGITGE